tara:strand:+ start:469 stop:690 length:222 start_codon:yes stop_codon:yes gene_type:complete
MDKNTKFMEVFNEELELANTFDSLNKCIELSKEISLTDLISPSSRTTGELAELIYRLQNLTEFEILDFNHNEA